LESSQYLQVIFKIITHIAKMKFSAVFSIHRQHFKKRLFRIHQRVCLGGEPKERQAAAQPAAQAAAGSTSSCGSFLSLLCGRVPGVHSRQKGSLRVVRAFLTEIPKPAAQRYAMSSCKALLQSSGVTKASAALQNIECQKFII